MVGVLTAAVVLALGVLAGVVWPAGARAEGGIAAEVGVDIQPKLGFVFLGDLWVYDDDTGQATRVMRAGGQCVGDPSWSLDFRSFAYEERAFVGDIEQTRVVFQERASDPGGAPVTHVFTGAASPAVSSEGRYCLYETVDDAGQAVLHVFDALGVYPKVLPMAFNGAWVPEASGETIYAAFNRGAADFPYNSGTYTDSRLTPVEWLNPVVYPGEPDDLSNAWGPQPGLDPGSLLATKYVESSGQIHVVLQTHGPGWGTVTLTQLLDVSDYESFDYRWFYPRGETPRGRAQQPFIELLSSAGPPVVFAVGDPMTLPSAALPPVAARFVGASFGWNASLPSESPFPDMHAGEAYYQAAAYLRISGIVSGFDDGSFGPAATSKRAQFAKMIVGALYLTPDGVPASPFNDLGPDVSPFYPGGFVAAAYQAGLVQGADPTTFNPYGTVTRAQVMTMVVRAARAFAADRVQAVPPGWSGALSSYTDPTHGENAQVAECNGLLEGIDLAGWDPYGPATRGEMAQMLYNLMALRGPGL
jgi:hypothetical protein